LSIAQPNLKKAVFFDRDGTLIIDRVYLNDPDQITYLDGAFEALTLLRDAGFTFVLVTNQSGVARGIVTLENLHEIHRRITTEFRKHKIEFAGIYYAPYSVESNHELRKPNAGMLTLAARELGLDLSQSWIVGDRMTDVEAGNRAGCRSVLLTGTDTPDGFDFKAPHAVCDDILSAARSILSVSK
jgi:D-glycero-D-manno-heptose 1,7-bisphosphate phosphatase